MLVYLLIVVNFQSWLDPFIIITALPGALAGIAWALFLTHTRLSVPALTGAIMTMGTATANAILVVSYARERLEEHGDALLAAIEAGNDPLPSGAHDRLGHDHRDGAHVDGVLPECAARAGGHRRLLGCDVFYPVLRAVRLRHRLHPANGSPRGRAPHEDPCAENALSSSRIVAGVLYHRLSRFMRAELDAAALREETLEDAVPTVAVVQSKADATDRDHYAPRQCCGVVSGADLRAGLRLCEDVVQGLRRAGEEGDILAEINAPALDAQYAQAKADLESERAKYDLAVISAKRWAGAAQESCGLGAVDLGEGSESESSGVRWSMRRSRTSGTSRR